MEQLIDKIGIFHQRSLLFSALAVAVLAALPASPARAQQTGTIKGTAEDVNGVPVKGIKITISGTTLIGGAQERLTDDAGSFRFLELPPGSYYVKAEAQGFRTATQEKIPLGLGQTVNLTMLMEAEATTEVVTVTARPLVVVDTEKVTMGQSISGELLEDVPSGRSYQDTAQLIPGVTGGGNPTVHGGSAYSNQYLVDGVNTTDPTWNTFNLNFNYDAIEELQVITGTFSPEYGNVTGGVINVVTKSGSNEFHLDTSVYYASDALMMQGLDEEERDFSGIQLNVNVGGPISKDRLWYFFSAEYDDSTSQLPAESPVPDLDGKQHAARQFRSLYWLGKLTWAPDAHIRFTLLAQGDPTRIDNDTQDATAEDVTETHQDQGGLLASLRWDGIFDPLVFKVQGAYKTSFLDIFPQKRVDGGSVFSFPGVLGFGTLSTKNSFGDVKGCIGPGETAEPDAVKSAGCSGDAQASPEFGRGFHYDLDTGASRMGGGTDYYILRQRWQLTATASYFLEAAGKHELKVGTDLSFMSDEETSRFPGGASIFLDTDMDGDGVADPYAARLASSDDNELTTVNDGRILAFFALDSWKLFDRVLLQPGVRVEKAVYENYLGEPVLDFFVVSPRFGFAADLTGDGRTRLHGGYGRLYETGNLGMSKFVGKSQQTRLAFYDPETGRYVENPDRIRLQGGASGSTIDEGIEPMTTDEYQIGLERAITDTFSLDLVYVHRDTALAWEDDEENLIWNQGGTEVLGGLDGTGQQRYRLRSMKNSYRTYDGIELIALKTMADRWSFSGSYTLSWLRGTTDELLTRAFDNPRQNIYLDGYLPEDHRHTIKAQVVYRFASGLSLGATFLHETGGPFSKYYMNDYDGDYTNRQAARGRDPGEDPNDPEDDKQLRLPDLTRIDLRAAFDLQQLTGLKLEAILDVFNALNASTVTGVETAMTETGGFGQPTNRQRPFSAQLGVRFRY